ncbi:MAG: NADH-quinone oxidoreductase subunit C [Verrucomicrobiales bacterium]
MTAGEIARALQDKLSADVASISEFRGEQTVTVTRDGLERVLAFCKEALGFDFFVDLTTVDNMGEDPRFEAVYELYSYKTNRHLRVKAAAPEDDAEFPSVTHLWPGANWHEREAWDMMGIRFAGHPNLKRILMWDGYPYFPLRKEFPLAGKPSEMPSIAFSDSAPLEGGPFVTAAGAEHKVEAEPRARPASTV